MPDALTAKLARLYIESPAVVPSAAELGAFRQWLRAQWLNVPARIVYTKQELNLQTVKRIYLQTGSLLISTANNDHPYFSFRENAEFRAVHDWHHILAGSDDTMHGEIEAYLVARSTAPQPVWWMLFSEIILQAAAFCACGSYQQQKLVRV